MSSNILPNFFRGLPLCEEISCSCMLNIVDGRVGVLPERMIDRGSAIATAATGMRAINTAHLLPPDTR